MKTSIILALCLSLCAFPAIGQDDSVQIKTVFTPYEDGQKAYLDFLSTAKHTIRIAIFGFTDPAITTELIHLKQQGVDVQIVMDKTQANGPHQRKELARLRHYSIPVTVGRSAYSQLMHAKFTSIDSTDIEEGSWNYSPSANLQDNYLNFVHSPERAKQFEHYWQQIKDDMK